MPKSSKPRERTKMMPVSTFAPLTRTWSIKDHRVRAEMRDSRVQISSRSEANEIANRSIIRPSVPETLAPLEAHESYHRIRERET